MKLAAIDIGSNSIHLIVARIDGEGNIEVIDRMKEMARLGDETLSTGYLSEAAQERGLAALRRLKQLADGYHVDDTIAVATSATREARNGSDFITRVADEVGVRARIITGVEEGRLIYLGTREIWPFGSRRALIVDVGGGSVEFVVADQRREYVVRSTKLGVRRLRERFLPESPASAEDVQALRSFIRDQGGAALDAVRRSGFDIVLGTSGTANAVTRLCNDTRGGADPVEPNHVPKVVLSETAERVLGLDDMGIATLDAVDDKRRDTIVVGTVLFDTLVDTLDADGFTFVDAALREGMIVDYLERNRPGLRMTQDVPDPRRRSVLLLANRFYNSTAHPRNVARLAARLFEATRSVHGLGQPEREWLEFAAILHNVGNAIARRGHHRHSLYIIRNGDLAGFTDRERLIIANVARYHRRSAPKSSHENYMALAPRDRETVKKLSALIRIANALDRGHRGNVHSLAAEVRGDRLELRILTHDDATLELRAARDQRDYVERHLGLRLDVDVATIVPRAI